jgi:TDG/mug DNA glycosylase family protein
MVRSAYYAHPRNRFWAALAEAGLVDRRMRPEEYRELLRHGIGLTDLAKQAHGLDKDLRIGFFDRAGLELRIRCFEPSVLAFNGQKAARIFLHRPRDERIDYGAQSETIGRTRIWVLPSTSPANPRWDVGPWRWLADTLG